MMTLALPALLLLVMLDESLVGQLMDETEVVARSWTTKVGSPAAASSW